jgi:aspartate/methionine/tyrosine aminotransferase
MVPLGELKTRLQSVQSPIIPLVGELIRQHPGTISLGQGVVFYGPPPESFTALTAGMANPLSHRYQAVEGIPPLIAALAQKLERENGMTIDDRRAIVVTAGSNMAFMSAILAITSPGDEIILQTPYYFNHEMAVMIADCCPVLVATDQNYQLRPAAIAQAITPRTRAIVTISPNNPTGVVYNQADLQAVNDLCRSHNLYHISDEAYEYFTYDGVNHVSPGSFAQSQAHTISLYSLSKAYGFASWRIGYMVIPRHLLESVQKIQDTLLICPPVVSQYAALGALEAGVDYCRQHLSTIATARQTMLQAIVALQDCCTVAPAQGAFYFFVKVQTELDAMTLTERLIRDYGVAVIPGTTFGWDQGCYLRLAYGAVSPETMVLGVERLVQGLKAMADRR